VRQNINPYNPGQFKKQFESTDIFQRITKDFDNICWTNNHVTQVNESTPRESTWDARPIFSLTAFYYLQPLLEKNPKVIYDLGCGWNIFKKYIPNIVGLDPDGKYADEIVSIDQEYFKNHQNFFESAFSINALHYRPLRQIHSVFTEFISMIKPGGRGFIAINIRRMLDRETIFVRTKMLQDTKLLELYIRKQLGNLPCTCLIFDVNLTELDEWLDGNVKLVFEK